MKNNYKVLGKMCLKGLTVGLACDRGNGGDRGYIVEALDDKEELFLLCGFDYVYKLDEKGENIICVGKYKGQGKRQMAGLSHRNHDYVIDQYKRLENKLS